MDNKTLKNKNSFDRLKLILLKKNIKKRVLKKNNGKRTEYLCNQNKLGTLEKKSCIAPKNKYHTDIYKHTIAVLLLFFIKAFIQENKITMPIKMYMANFKKEFNLIIPKFSTAP
jgi:hypothetical protein